MTRTSKDGMERRHLALLASASIFVMLSIALAYVGIGDYYGSPPEQSIAGTVQSSPTFPSWFFFSLMATWSISLMALIALYLLSRKPKLSSQFS